MLFQFCLHSLQFSSELDVNRVRNINILIFYANIPLYSPRWEKGRSGYYNIPYIPLPHFQLYHMWRKPYKHLSFLTNFGLFSLKILCHKVALSKKNIVFFFSHRLVPCRNKFTLDEIWYSSIQEQVVQFTCHGKYENKGLTILYIKAAYVFIKYTKYYTSSVTDVGSRIYEKQETSVMLFS